MRRLLLAALLLLPISSRLYATDQTVLGNELVVKNPTTPDRRKIVAKGLEKASDDTIVGDPTVTGATLTITANGTSPSSQTVPLPAGMSPTTGRRYWTGSMASGFKYKDARGENGPVKLAQILKEPNGFFLVKAVLLSRYRPITVVPPHDGTDGCMLFTINGGDSYSVKFGADGTITNKGTTFFKVSTPTVEGSCVPTTTTTTTTSTSTTTTTLNGLCSNGTVDPGEQCDPPGSPCGVTAEGGGAVPPGLTCQIDCTCPCEFLDGTECLFPFPSDYLTQPDPTTDTGRRVHFATASMPRNNNNVPIVAADYNLNDGFSQGVTILLHVPNVDLGVTGAVPITDVAQSQDPDAPIVVVNATTLAHHPIWAEIDSNATTEATRSVIIHPAVNFDEGTRYIVALRNMKDGTGAIIPAGADFAAYRDDTPTGDPVKEARRAHMEELFTTLGNAGIARDDLYLAWDFTVASRRNITERMLFVRDDGFDRLGSAAPAFVVTNVFEHSCITGSNPFGACSTNADCTLPPPGGGQGTCSTTDGVDAQIFRRVVGTYQVERYVDSTATGARFQLDANGLPIHQPTRQPASFVCNIPRAALAGTGATAVPARASIYGHGLLGSNTEVNAGNVEAMANEHNFVFCATKWIGMADEDIGTALGILQDLGKFPELTDRVQQSMLDQLFLARLMIHSNGFVSHPAFQDGTGNPVIDTSDVFYDGNSQGGIFGGTVMAIAQDITRGVLGVPGMNYSLLLTRSTDFNTYKAFLYPAYPNEAERPLGLALIQMLWDRSDPDGYARHIVNDPLPGTPSHQVLMHLAFGDHQVTNVATEVEARTIGASIHQPAIAPGRNPDVTPYLDIPAIPSYPFDGSALVVWDSGAATPPITNTPPTVGPDPHSDPRSSVIARNQKAEFLRTGGDVIDVCSGAPCVPSP